MYTVYWDVHIVRPNKKFPVFRVTRPYLNLLVIHSFFFRFSGKNIILCILKGEMPFKRHKIVFFSIILCILKGEMLFKRHKIVFFSIIVCILKGEMLFKMHEIIFFSRKNNN